jgi:hypothetical protein
LKQGPFKPIGSWVNRFWRFGKTLVCSITSSLRWLNLSLIDYSSWTCEFCRRRHAFDPGRGGNLAHILTLMEGLSLCAQLSRDASDPDFGQTDRKSRRNYTLINPGGGRREEKIDFPSSLQRLLILVEPHVLAPYLIKWQRTFSWPSQRQAVGLLFQISFFLRRSPSLSYSKRKADVEIVLVDVVQGSVIRAARRPATSSFVHDLCKLNNRFFIPSTKACSKGKHQRALVHK